MRLIVAAMLVWTCMVASAQRKPRIAAPARAAWPVESIKIEGLDAYTQEQVLAALKLKPGQMAAGKDFEAARDRLLATGAFDSAGVRYTPAPDGKGYVVTFEVVEAGPRFPMLFEELGVPADDIKAVLKRNDPFFAPTVPATQPLLARYAKAIEDYLASRGSAAKIVGKLEPGDDGKLSVVFRPAGARPVVARVQFAGNSVVPSQELENAINSVAVGLPYKESRFLQLLDTQVRPLYDKRGRVRAVFSIVRAEPEKDVKGLALTVKVDEGVSYSLGSVEVQGSGLSPAELKKLTAAEFKPGGVFNRDTLEAGIGKIESRMRRGGYMQVKSKVERRINDQTKKVDSTVHIEPGPRYTFGTLNVEGLDIITEPAIRKMWGMKPGDPFNSEYPDYFLSQVKEEGILDNLGETKSKVTTNDESHTADVTLVFKGAPPKPKKGDRNQQGTAGPGGPFAGNGWCAWYRE